MLPNNSVKHAAYVRFPCACLVGSDMQSVNASPCLLAYIELQESFFRRFILATHPHRWRTREVEPPSHQSTESRLTRHPLSASNDRCCPVSLTLRLYACIQISLFDESWEPSGTLPSEAQLLWETQTVPFLLVQVGWRYEVPCYRTGIQAYITKPFTSIFS